MKINVHKFWQAIFFDFLQLLTFDNVYIYIIFEGG